MTKKGEKQLYNIPAAAVAAGVNESTLRKAVKRGALPSTPIAGDKHPLVYLEDVIAWKSKRKPSNAGRPKTNRAKD